MKTVLVYVNDDAGLDSRLDAALSVVRALDGRLVCCQPATAAELAIDHYAAASPTQDSMTGDRVRAAAQQADALTERVVARLQDEKVDWSWRHNALGAVQAIIRESALADLIVLSAPNQNYQPDIARAFIGEIALLAAAPVLTIPLDLEEFDVSGPVLAAWNGSLEATRTIRSNIGLLQKASEVHLVSVGQAMLRGFDAVESKAYFALLGLDVEVSDIAREGSTTESLLQKAAEIGASYILLGAYGHSRFREAIFGGVTRAMLSQDRFPLILHH
jgi:nucleotide-binding universal stress UspA family protein